MFRPDARTSETAAFTLAASIEHVLFRSFLLDRLLHERFHILIHHPLREEKSHAVAPATLSNDLSRPASASENGFFSGYSSLLTCMNRN